MNKSVKQEVEEAPTNRQKERYKDPYLLPTFKAGSIKTADRYIIITLQITHLNTNR